MVSKKIIVTLLIPLSIIGCMNVTALQETKVIDPKIENLISNSDFTVIDDQYNQLFARQIDRKDLIRFFAATPCESCIYKTTIHFQKCSTAKGYFEGNSWVLPTLTLSLFPFKKIQSCPVTLSIQKIDNGITRNSQSAQNFTTTVAFWNIFPLYDTFLHPVRRAYPIIDMLNELVNNPL